jgi:hypothetical protein
MTSLAAEDAGCQTDMLPHGLALATALETQAAFEAMVVALHSGDLLAVEDILQRRPQLLSKVTTEHLQLLERMLAHTLFVAQALRYRRRNELYMHTVVSALTAGAIALLMVCASREAGIIRWKPPKAKLFKRRSSEDIEVFDLARQDASGEHVPTSPKHASFQEQADTVRTWITYIRQDPRCLIPELPSADSPLRGPDGQLIGLRMANGILKSVYTWTAIPLVFQLIARFYSIARASGKLRWSKSTHATAVRLSSLISLELKQRHLESLETEKG